MKKGNDPTDKDWEELNHQSEIQLVGSKCSVSIVPDTANGTKTDADSGMKGVYMTISSDLTLNGTPKDAGSYLFILRTTKAAQQPAMPCPSAFTPVRKPWQTKSRI